jgi:protein-histidine pros-kinase
VNIPGVRGIIRRNLIAVFLVSLIGGVGGFYVLLRDQALREAEQRADILLSSALAVRNYTSTRVNPVISGFQSGQFHEETVPSFAAQTVFASVTAGAAAYTYREPALNPTNKADLAGEFEVDLIRRFRGDPKLKDLSGFRDTGGERLFYLARPIRIKDAKCLVCHDTPARAPAAMLAKYGSENGFGWKLNEIVGIQLLTVPVTEQFRSMLKLVGLLAGGLAAIFAIAYLALAISLEALLVRPLSRLAAVAEGASKGERMALPKGGAYEVRRLSDAIDRLRTSLRKSLEDLERRRGGDPEARP